MRMMLTKTRRIILNTLATYGRSIFGLIVGVFSSRWFLQGLGAQDLGLQGVVGSLVSAIVILETVMQVAVSRFYAFAIGKAQTLEKDAGSDEICRWFNVVLLIYTLLPVIVVIVGYPIGVYAIRRWLVIPADRMAACVYVFQCSLATTFITMISVPYIAMYTARQEIVELSLFGILRSLFNFVFAFSIIYVSFDRLRYSGTGAAIITLIILSLQMYRARKCFPECRLKVQYMFDKRRLKEIFSYFFWEIFSCTGNMTRQQGSAIVVNKYYGPSVNAALSIANSLSNQATALSNALNGALLPAVTTEEGAGERENMIRLAFRSCKFGALLILLFSIPLIVEIDEVLRLWLVNPPEYTGEICVCILIAYSIDKLGLGHHVAISANGKIGFYHSVVGTTFFLSIPIAILLIVIGFGPNSIGLMFIICYSLVSMERIIFAKHLVNMPVVAYIKDVVLPLLILSLTTYLISNLVTRMVAPSFYRVLLTTIVALLVMAVVSWKIVLDCHEKCYIFRGFQKVVQKIGLHRL